jgi:hypothetical protein
MTTKSPAQVLYPECVSPKYEFFDAPASYDPIINSFGSVLVQVDDDDWSGDTRALLHKDGRYGFLNFGWGSCSGCDALRACYNYEQIDELINELEGSIKWFETLGEAQAYVADNQERQGSYYYHTDKWEEFKSKVAETSA